MSKPKLLICGDSYMSLDPRLEFRQLHWSWHLREYANVVNIARPGTSNAQVVYSLTEYLKNNSSPDFIVMGFTSPYRIEYDLNKTSCFCEVLNNKKFKKFVEHYVRYQRLEIECTKTLALICYGIDKARKNSKLVYSLNNFRREIDLLGEETINRIIDKNDYNKLVENQISVNLLDYFDFEPHTDDKPVFHVIDPVAHQKYADEIISRLGLEKFKNN